MKRLQKLWQADDRRPTRFHTQRGEFVGLTNLLGLPSEFVLRMCKVRRAGPWMCRDVVDALAKSSGQYQRILELGSGSSTLWFLAMGKSVVSLEDDSEWADWVMGQVGAAGDQLEIIVGDLRDEFMAQLPQLGDYDMVVVDHNEHPGFTRMQALESLVDFQGVICLDNSDRAEYRGAASILQHHEPSRYTGMLRAPFQASETTLFWPRASNTRFGSAWI